MSFITKALETIGDITGLKNPVKTILNAIKGDPELDKQLKQLELEESNNIRDLYKAEVQTEDKFVRRARPALLWLTFAIIAMNFVILPLFNTFASYFGHTPITFVFPDLPTEVYWLIGSIFGFYTGARTTEKLKGANKN